MVYGEVFGLKSPFSSFTIFYKVVDIFMFYNFIEHENLEKCVLESEIGD